MEQKNKTKVRWIIHRENGESIASGWNTDSCSWRQNWARNITSVQLQTLDSKLYTLSTKKADKTMFWQEDNYISPIVLGKPTKGILVSRSILKKIGGCPPNVPCLWLRLTVDMSGNCKVDTIIKKIW